MNNWSAFDGSGGAYPVATNNWGGGTGLGGGLAAGLVGGLLGGALLGGNGLFGGGSAKDVAVETSKQVGDLQGEMFTSALAAADRGYQQTIAFNNQMNSVDRDVLIGTYDTSRQMCDGFNTSNVVSLQNKYENALQLAHLGEEQQECCCKLDMDIVKMGYETQLRDQSQFGCLMTELKATQCLIKDTENNGIMRAQAEKICSLENRLTKEELIAAMKPVSPVPAYIQANPYENFMPTVRVAQYGGYDNRSDCGNRWGYNNNCCGYQ